MRSVATVVVVAACCVSQACTRLHAPESLELRTRRIPFEPARAVELSDTEKNVGVRIRRAGGSVAGSVAGKGICVLLPGILGSHSSPTCEHGLCDDGWDVVVVEPKLVSSVLTELKVEVKVDDGGGRYRQGERVGRAVDGVIEAAAAAAGRAVLVLTAVDERLRDRPVIVVGESLGALMGVGVVRTGFVPCDAAVFVAGGGSLLDVAERSSLRRILFGDLPIDDPDFRAGFAAGSRLDSLAAAGGLRGCPVVCVTAAIDLIVPTDTQEALWTALGEPPRYRFDGGHLELFTFAEWNILPAVRAVAAVTALPSAP